MFTQLSSTDDNNERVIQYILDIQLKSLTYRNTLKEVLNLHKGEYSHTNYKYQTTKEATFKLEHDP
jgi:hypothetical protein